MRRHCLSVHASVKPYSCFVCGQGFTRTEKVKRHMIRTHPGEAYDYQRLKIPAPTDTCLSPDSRTPSPRVTSSSDNTDKDISCGQIIHGSPKHDFIDSNKALQCVQCDYTTTDENHLHIHKQSHSKLECPYCRFRTCDLEAYMYHLKGCIRHHHSEANLLTCDYCQEEILSQ